MKRLIDDGFNTAKTLIDDNRLKLELIANSLLEYETLDGSQVEEIVRTGKFNPPQAPEDPPTPPMGAQAVTSTPEPESPKTELDPGFGGASPATA